jgi:hypothetical protein
MRALILAVAVLSAALPCAHADFIVYTANQGWLSRVYVLDMAGSVDRFFEYEFYRFCGAEVVDGEVYLAEAFAPRVLKIDLDTGDLDVIVDDWTLYYFYDVAFDGTFFYVDEWDLNRYWFSGVKEGMAGFDEGVLGMAWDGEHLLTLDDSNLIKCWDIAGWPSVVEVPELAFAPPSAACRGLFYDGEAFWTAESIADELGRIYRFTHDGTILRMWDEPAYQGWGACVVRTADADAAGASSLSLQPIRPNPVAGAATVHFNLPAPSRVSLRIYNVAGELVDTVASGEFGAGPHEVAWDAGACASGVYLARLEAGGEARQRKLLVLR